MVKYAILMVLELNVAGSKYIKYFMFLTKNRTYQYLRKYAPSMTHHPPPPTTHHYPPHNKFDGLLSESEKIKKIR